MNIKRLAARILILTLLLSLWGCRGKSSAKTDAAGGDPAGTESVAVSEDGTRWLTHIYKPQAMEMPEGWLLNNEARIEYDAGTDTFRAILFRSEEVETENGFRQFVDKKIVVWNGEGALVSQTPLNDPVRMILLNACFCGDRLYCLLVDYTTGAGERITAWDAATGDLIAERDVRKIKGWSNYGKRHMAADEAGNLYAGDGSQVQILTPEFAMLNTVSANTFDMKLSPDGDIWAVCPTGDGRAVFSLDLTTGQKKEIIPLDSNGAEMAFLPAADGNGFSVAASVANGISLYETDDGEHWVSEELLNFTNSDISYNSKIERRDGSMKMAAAADRGRLVFVLSELDENGKIQNRPLLFREAPDLDLSSVRTITLAHDRELKDNIQYQIVRFNREHDDIQVTTLDYSSYNTSENLTGGSWKLATDMLNGLVKPDVVFGYWTLDSIEQLMRKGLTVDLGPYMDADPEVNRKTVVGCVLRSFDNGNGGYWGITPYFDLETVVGMRSVLGAYSDGWDLEGFLDFAENLPAGRILTSNGSRQNRGSVQIDLRQFVREDGCSFDSPLFIRYLSWVNGLPDPAELKKISPAAGLYGEQLDKYYADGTVALNPFGCFELLELIGLRGIYGEEEIAFPGDPSADGTGTTIYANDVFVIPSFAHDPDAAWEFIRSFLLEDDLTSMQRWYVSIGMPSLRSNLEKEAEQILSMKKAVLQNGITEGFGASVAEDYIRSLLDRIYKGVPYTIEPYCTEADIERALALIDSGGRPFREELPDELEDILEEEISAFLGRLGTAEDCAKKIQSRASIWLAENKP